MKRTFRYSSMIAVAVLGWLVAITAAVAAPNSERLIPATFMERQDSNGFAWNITQNGGLANDSRGCFQYALFPMVNGVQFNYSQQQMTADSSVFVLSGARTQQGLEASRRISVDLKHGILQYIDTFRNTTAAPASTTIMVPVRLGSQAVSVITDRGNPASGQLSDKDTGVLIMNQAHLPSPVFYLNGPKSKVRASFSAIHNNFQFNINYSLTIPPGKESSILIGVAQRNVAGTPDAKALAALFKPFKEASWSRMIPKSLQRTIANGRGGGAYGSTINYGEDVPALLAELGEDRGPHDTLRIGETTRLRGTLKVKDLTVASLGEDRRVPLDRVAAIVGHDQNRRSARLLLRDGQMFVGKITPAEFKFALNSGLEAMCDLANLDRLVLREQSDDGQPAAGVLGFVEFAEGDRLAVVSGPPQKVVALTAWGERRMALGDVHHWSLPSSGQETTGSRIVLNDGSSFTAFLMDDKLTLQTTDHGKQQRSVLEIQRFRTAAATSKGKDSDRALVMAPHVLLAGDNLFVGQLESPVVHLVSGGQIIPLAPQQIKFLRRADSDSTGLDEPVFQVTLWDGDVAEGTLRERTLPLRAGGDLLQVPATDLVEVHVPTPTVPESLRTKIAELITDLGDSQWSKRESAMKELMDFGAVGLGQYQEALEQTSDLEVQKRLQTLIDAAKE